jgi:hypothetical protein
VHGGCIDAELSALQKLKIRCKWAARRTFLVWQETELVRRADTTIVVDLRDIDPDYSPVVLRIMAVYVGA